MKHTQITAEITGTESIACYPPSPNSKLPIPTNLQEAVERSIQKREIKNRPIVETKGSEENSPKGR